MTVKSTGVRFAALILAALAALSFAPHALAAGKVLKITAIVEHPALDAVRKGTLDVLAENGFKQGDNLEVEFQSAQGDMGTAGQIARKFVGDNPDVILAIATPSAQTVVSAARGSVPVVFSAVTDPLGAKLVSNMAKPGGNVTGVSDMSPIGKHLDLIKEISPDAKRIGVPFNPGEANAVSLLNLLKKEAPGRGLTIVEAPAPDTNSVLAAARSLVGKVDVIYTPTDNTVVSALEGVVKVGMDSKLPVYAGDTDSVPRGAIAALGFDYYDVGRQTGLIVLRILNGEKPGDIAVQGIDKTKLHINLGTAAKMGVTFSDAVIKRADKVIK